MAIQAMAGLYLAQNLKTHVDVLNEIKAAIVELRKVNDRNNKEVKD